jgi:hypothetical protein
MALIIYFVSNHPSNTDDSKTTSNSPLRPPSALAADTAAQKGCAARHPAEPQQYAQAIQPRVWSEDIEHLEARPRIRDTLDNTTDSVFDTHHRFERRASRPHPEW